MSEIANKLKRLTQEAVQRGKEARERDEQASREKERRRLNDEKLRAQRVIEKIPELAEKAAQKGQNSVDVMELTWEDYKTNDPHKTFSDAHLICGRGVSLVKCSAAELVMLWCMDAGLQPTIEDWHDGCGMRSGYNITIHW